MEPKQILEQMEQIFNDKLNKLYKSIESMIDKKLADIPKDFMKSYECSESQAALAQAFAKAQGEFGQAGFNKINTFHKNKYADLASLQECIFPITSKYGLSIDMSTITTDEEQDYLVTTLTHASGEFRRFKTRIIADKSGPQGMMSGTTYLKRRVLSALCGVTGADDDDDGETAQSAHRDNEEKGTALRIQSKKSDESYERINTTELNEIKYTCENYPDIYKDIAKSYGIDSVADLPKSEYRNVIDKCRQRIKVREKK